MRKFLLAGVALLGIAALARAQVNVVPQVGVATANLRQNTYGAISVGLVPASSATDIACLDGAASKTVTLRRLVISGTAGTAITTPVVVLRRATLDTGGTPATGLALPVAGKFNSTEPASVATLTAYTANPTVNDSSPTYLMAPAVSFAVTTGAVSPTVLNFGSSVDAYDMGLDLKSATQQICLNLNAATVATGVLAISMEWVEQ